MLIKFFPILLFILTIAGMSPKEKSQLRLQVIDMFKHGFGSYMVKKPIENISLIANRLFFCIEICLSC